MSVVDQRVRLAGGLLGRLLLRVLLVLGGAFVATVLGWCLNCASASADVLPQPVPSLPQVISPQVIDVVAPQLSTSELPAASSLPCACLDGVTKQVRTTVDDTGDRVAPAPVAHVVAISKMVAAPVVARTLPVVHIVVPQVIRPKVRRAAGAPRAPAPRAPAPPVHHSPVFPPAQPMGSSDSGAHGSGGVAGGTGVALASFAHVIGAGPAMAGLPAVPRLAASPGQQPGTSPD